MEGKEVAIINDYPAKDFNVLLAATATTMAPNHRIVMCKVKIDPTVAKGDVYPQKGGLAFHKQALMRLADAAGIRFTGNDSKRHDDLSVTYTVYGKMGKADGMEHDLIGTYTWDVPARREQVRLDAKEKGKEIKAQDLLNVLKFAYMRAETGAMERLVRSALGLKSSYSKAELDKPFALARVVKDEPQDPVSQIVRAITAAGGTVGAEAITAIIAAMGVKPQPVAQLEDPEPVAQLEAGEEEDILSATAPSEKGGEPPTNGDAWIEDKAMRDAFSDWLHNEMGLTNAHLLEALRVSTMRGWRKPLDDTKRMISDWAAGQSGAEVAQGELV